MLDVKWFINQIKKKLPAAVPARDQVSINMLSTFHTWPSNQNTRRMNPGPRCLRSSMITTRLYSTIYRILKPAMLALPILNMQPNTELNMAAVTHNISECENLITMQYPHPPSRPPKAPNTRDEGFIFFTSSKFFVKLIEFRPKASQIFVQLWSLLIPWKS